MNWLRVTGYLCVCMLVMGLGTSFGAGKPVKIDNNCQVDDPNPSISHNPKLGDYVRWTSSKPYIVQFKNFLSPCYDQNGTHLLTIEVGPPQQSICFAPNVTPDTYKYSIYRQGDDGKWTECNDPAVIVTDGNIELKMPKLSPKSSKKPAQKQ